MGDLTDEADVDASLLARALSTWEVSTKVAAYVVADKANPTTDEQALLAELRKQFHCDLVDDDDVADAKMDYTAYSTIIVGNSSDVAKLSNLTDLAIPLIFTEGEHAATIGKMATVGAGNYGTSTGTQCNVTNTSHPTVLTEALGVHDVYTESGNFGWLLSTALAGGVGVFANIEGESTHIGLAVLPLDGINSDSLASPEIRYFFGAQEPGKYTSHTWEHVKWIADWLVHQIALATVVYSLEQSRVIQDMLGRGQFKLPTNLYDYLVTGTTGSAPFEVIAEQESRSVMERLEWIKNALRRGTGTILPTNKSLYDVIALDRLDHATYGLSALKTLVDAVKAKTDLIPADITTQLDTNVPAIKAKTDLIPASPATEGTSTAIKAKTDALPSDPADESAVEAAITAAHATTDGKVDTVDTVVDAIKTQTDKMPRILCHMDFWSLAKQITITSAAGDKGLVDVVVSGLPSNVTIIAVQGMFMCDSVQNSAVDTANYLESTKIQVHKKAAGTDRDAIVLEANKAFRFNDDMIRGGTVFVADWATATAAGILAEVATNTTYEMWFDVAEAVANNLVLDGAAFGLRIWFTI